MAWRQDGLLDAKQLRAQGLGGRDQWNRLVQRGLLVRGLPGIFRLADAPLTKRRAWRAAIMWRKDGALSHLSAAKFWDFPGFDTSYVHLTVPSKVSADKVVVHRATLWPDDVVVRQGLRVTSPARTLMDLATMVDEERLAVAVEAAWRRRLICPEKLLRRLRDLPYQAQKDVGRLPSLLLDAHRRGRPLESPLEVRFWRLLMEHGVPLPLVQVRFRDHHGELRVDFLWPGARLIVETQGRAHHLTADGFERSALRSQRLRAQGYSMVVVTWLQLEQEPSAVMDRISNALGAHMGAEPLRPVIHEAELVPPEVLALFEAA